MQCETCGSNVKVGLPFYVTGWKYIEIKLRDIIYTSRTNEHRSVRAVACISYATVGGLKQEDKFPR
jgi:hypothetical protein